MGIDVIDTFSAYSTGAQMTTRGWVGTGATMTPSAGNGQSGLSSVRCTSPNNGARRSYPISASTDETVGFCFKGAELSVGANGAFFFYFESGGTEVTGLAVSANGAFEVWDVSGGDALRASSVPNLFHPGIEHYIECRIICSTTVGEAYVWLNGAPTPIISATGLDTGSGSVSQLSLVHHSGATYNAFGTTDHSMFYALRNADPVTHLGHIRGAVLLPTGNGNQSDFIGSDGNQVDNYALVDDTTPNDDTDYVYSPTAGDIDTYAMSDMPSTPQTIYAVQSLLWAKKTDAGSRSIAPVLRSGGTDYPGTDWPLGTTYQYATEIFIEDPDTTNPWDETGVNAVEFGPKVAS